MIVKLGDKKLEYSDILAEGCYEARIRNISLADKAMIGAVYLDRIQLEVDLKVKHSWVKKDKFILVSDKAGSELNNLLDNFQELLMDQSGEINLERLIEIPCKAYIVHNESKSGNVFANIGEIIRGDGLDG